MTDFLVRLHWGYTNLAKARLSHPRLKRVTAPRLGFFSQHYPKVNDISGRRLLFVHKGYFWFWRAHPVMRPIQIQIRGLLVELSGW